MEVVLRNCKQTTYTSSYSFFTKFDKEGLPPFHTKSVATFKVRVLKLSVCELVYVRASCTGSLSQEFQYMSCDRYMIA
jgi:hypothetical protein